MISRCMSFTGCERVTNIKYRLRETTVPAMVIPGAKTILFGAIPLEALDLMVNPVTQEVVGVHGDNEEFMAL